MKETRPAVSILRSKGAPKKLFIGGLYGILSFTVFFAFVVTGYTMNVLCTALEGRRSKMPEWTNLKALFHEGLQPVLICLAYSSPMIVLIIAEINLQTADMFATSYLWPFYLLLILVVSAFLPLALIRSVVKASLKSAFEFKKITGFIKNNPGTYLSAWAKSIAIYMAATIILLGSVIGTAKLFFLASDFTVLIAGSLVTLFVTCFTFFTSSIIVVYIFAKAYRSSKPFDDDRYGEMRASIAIPPPLIK